MRRISFQLVALITLVVLACVSLMIYFTRLNVRQQIQALPPSISIYLRDDGAPANALPEVSGLGGGPRSSAQNGAADDTDPSSAPFGVNFQSDLTRFPSDWALSMPPRPRNFRRNLDDAFLLSGLIAATLGVVLALLVVRRVVRPIEAVSKAASRLAAGDLSARAVGAGPRSSFETESLARNFNRMAEALEKLERERKSMIADIAHELRTPLTVMQSRLDALEDGVIAFSPEEVGRLSTQTQLLTRLVEDLRTLSLADAGRLSMHPRTLELNGQLELALDGFSARFEDKGVRLEFASVGGVWVSCDPQRLAQVWVNLLENALRHTPPGGWVRLEVEAEGGEAQVLLTDSGPGIAPENLRRIFDRFFREHEERSREFGGSGLGLAIVQALLSLMGGRVEAENAPGAGAQFRVTLPVLERAPERENARALAA